MVDEPIVVEIDKVSSLTGGSLPGATLQLLDEEGNVAYEWVSDGHPHRIELIRYGTYTLHEAVTPEGYVTAEDMLINVQEIQDLQEYVMVDEPIIIEIDKVSSLTGGSLPGATLQLLDEEGNVAYEWVSDGHPHRIELIKYGTYILHEAVTPEGYVTAEDMLIDVQEIQDLQEYVMVDEPIIIEIDKVSSLTGGSLPGATLQLLDEDGKVAYEWVSDGHPHRIELIKYGTYILHEAVTPEGYVTAEDMLIDVKEVSEVQEYVMVDEPIIIEIDKIANDTNMSLPEATLQLIDEDGNVVYEWVTDGKSHVIYAIPSGIYTLHEVKSPDKYVLAKDIVVDVKETPEIQKFKMVDMRIGRILTVLISPDVIPVGTPSTNTIGSPSPGTGDETNITYLSLLLFSAITAVSSVKKGSKRKVN